MPKRLIKKIKGLLSGNTETPIARVIPRGEHDFPEEDIRRSVLTVLDGLTDAGYEAYLVGGSIRDGLIGLHPKDFDIATSATPEQIKAVFPRNCRLIGRRFRLAHVRFGREILEVATFRGCHSKSETNENHSSQSEEGMLLRDNVFGTLDEDAVRRDFTANALYYRHTDGAVLDYVDGYEDILHRTLRLIGDPEQRYREDPVRMLRAARFAAKLGFELDADTAGPIPGLAELLLQVPPARLFDEVLKLFLSGHARASYTELRRLGLFTFLFPETEECLTGDQGELWERLILAAMDNTDRRLAQDKPVTPAFILAVLLWPVVVARFDKLRGDGMPPAPALHKAAGWALAQQVDHTAVPRRFSTVMREMWDLQQRLPRRGGKRAETLIQHPRFRAAYDFLLLREDAGEIKPGLGAWWTRYQQLDEQERYDMVQALGPNQGGGGGGGGGRRRRRRRPRSGGNKD
ncbi:MAG TPA: polynucleotide adenylyltransferase PcnB [Gammaproteobacteria bacterium]|nr:polynucleotide adenylyltransferase PcnB [Gammaproteobacteria bacterium]